MEAGGWQVMKRARMLVDQGRVLDVAYDGKLVKGTVGDGKRNQRSGMLIRGRTDVENLCSCPEARRTGILCQHALALGVAVARGQAKAEDRSPTAETKSSRASQGRKPAPKSGSEFVVPTGALAFQFSKQAAQGFGRGSLSVQVQETDASEGAEQDLAFLAWLQKMGQTRVPPHLMLQKVHLSSFLTAMQGHPRLGVGDDDAPLRVESVPLRLALKLESKGEDEVSLEVEVPQGLSLAVSEGAVWGWLLDRGCILRLPRLGGLAAADAEALMDSVSREGRPLVKSWSWFFKHAGALEDVFRLDTKRLPRMPRVSVLTPGFRLAIEGSLNYLEAELTCEYEGRKIPPGEPSDAFPFSRADETGEWGDRNPAAERQAVERLERAGFSEPNAKAKRVLKGEGDILKFFASDLPALQRLWEVDIGERFAHVTRGIERIVPELKITAPPDGGWLDVDIGYSGDGESQLPRHEIERLLRVGQSQTRLRNGRRAVVDLSACEELSEVLRDIEPEQDFGRYRISPAQEDFLKATLGAFAGREVGDIPQASFPTAALKDLESILRDYQREGVCWMLARTERGLSGILADEMGLGKTLQSLATLQALHAVQPESEAPASVIVCPTSLLDNWCREAARFTPELRVLKIHGAKRDRLWKEAAKADLLVTSYGMLVRDLKRFQERSPLAVFLDEASAIKNPTTKNAQAAFQLGGQYRFALTGTPVENSVRDLWSIMQFVAPGYLGSHKAFKERYEVALASEVGAPPALSERLRRRLRPFILRRTKRSVARELPDRIEKVISCELSKEQRDTYTSLLRAGREKVVEARDQGAGVARITMLTTLLRLRQVCCDLRLLKGSGSGEERPPSGKMDAVRELLEEAHAGGHRVLIFSQFVSMLKLLQVEAESLGLAHCYLDGQSRDRQAEVDRFQKGETPLFLISLKAGGYGLNLTAADTVIHFDPWWNPAVEAQATDRAHRIGQKNVVTSYKLITEDTVEEKILRLQRRKRQVMDAALDDEQPLMQGLTSSDLEELLEV